MTFNKNKRPEILKALANTEPSEIAKAVAKKIEEYTAMLGGQSDKHGEFPDPLRLPAPKNELEKIALSLFIDKLKKTSSAKIEIT